jgi:outer membrane protein assembly factor BamB
MFAAIWGSPMVMDGKVYLGDEDGDVAILQAGKEKKLIAEINMGSSVYSTPVPANGAMYIMNRNQLFALANGTKTDPAKMAPPTVGKDGD